MIQVKMTYLLAHQHRHHLQLPPDRVVVNRQQDDTPRQHNDTARLEILPTKIEWNGCSLFVFSCSVAITTATEHIRFPAHYRQHRSRLPPVRPGVAADGE